MADEPTHITRPCAVPDLDWSPDRARALGDEAVGLWAELLDHLPDLPVARAETPAQVNAALLHDVPDSGLPTPELMAHLRSLVLEHSVYPGHPRFMAYISGAGTVPGAAADLLAAALNQNVGGWMLSPAATEIEQNLIRWLGNVIGYPNDNGGLMTAGGATATLTALKAAHDHHRGASVRTDGLRTGAQMVCYASSEAHVVIERAADILGLGSASVRHVPVDGTLRMRTDALVEMINTDRAEGRDPFAVIGTAGTTGTGSVDPLDEIADVCARENLWFHVDGAYGAPAMLVPELRPLFVGIDRADSVALDPHKWLYVPLAVGCVLLRDARRLPESFGVEASYVHQDRDLVERGDDLGFAGVDFSRGFAALKVWVSLLAHGRDAYVRRIRHDAELARYLDALVRDRPEFEPMATVTLSIACFRYVPVDIDATVPDTQPYLDQLNERLMTTIQSDGRVFCSNTVIDGRYALRACIVNFRTEAVDVEMVLDVAAELGAQIDAELRAGSPTALANSNLANSNLANTHGVPMNPDRIHELGTILSVWAHPDDEAFLAGGIMAMAADAGSRVVCVTATRGEAGSPDPERFPPHIMAKIREQELDECLAILGVTEHLWLDYRDGTCADVPLDEAATKLETIIGSVRPDTILTFGPEGFTDHPDHKAVSRWLTEAHNRSDGASRRRVHFATESPGWIDRYGDVMAEVSVFPPGFPPSTPVDALSIDAQLSAAINDRKVQALRAQASQIEGLVQAIGLPMFRSAFAYERYRAA